MADAANFYRTVVSKLTSEDIKDLYDAASKDALAREKGIVKAELGRTLFDQLIEKRSIFS